MFLHLLGTIRQQHNLELLTPRCEDALMRFDCFLLIVDLYLTVSVDTRVEQLTIHLLHCVLRGGDYLLIAAHEDFAALLYGAHHWHFFCV
jgi:hypothetical protein